MTAYSFIRPATERDWSEYHRIRREVLFEARGRVGVYDETHPDDRAPDNHACLLLCDGRPIATARIDHDRASKRAMVRLLAVDHDAQRSGHGRELLRSIEHHSLQLGCVEIVANATKDAVAWYVRHGFVVEVWDPAQPPRGDGVQVRKRV